MSMVQAAGVLSVAAGLACAQGVRPMPRLLETGIRVEPVRVAPAVFENGAVERVGDWTDYGTPRGAHDTCHDYRVFDCYGDHNWDGYPDDAGGCGMGSGRWFFGTGYCGSPFTTNDMELAPDAIISEGAWRADIAWYWTCLGFETEQCVVAIFLEESFAGDCEVDSFEYPGWIIDFGELECAPAGYYRAAIDISRQGRWILPQTGRGSYAVMYLTDDGRQPGSCTQQMLWGSPNNWGGDPDGPGAQGPAQFEDDGDLVHDLDECYVLDFGVCPDPLGMMAQFWGERESPPGNRADFNNDGSADTRDIITFLAAWASCEPRSDCDGNDECTTEDVLCFLEQWVTCRN